MEMEELTKSGTPPGTEGSDDSGEGREIFLSERTSSIQEASGGKNNSTYLTNYFPISCHVCMDSCGLEYLHEIVHCLLWCSLQLVLILFITYIWSDSEYQKYVKCLTVWPWCHRTEPPPGSFLRGREYSKYKISPQGADTRKLSPPPGKKTSPYPISVNAV